MAKVGMEVPSYAPEKLCTPVADRGRSTIQNPINATRHQPHFTPPSRRKHPHVIPIS
ncbi:hypothetical protein EMPG_14144 [Blastomyces silverae]|uniref:Uncharacterized protein n=1 Tax=Blastomyces silverae TaxID=2060906 RepID=A0A0H1BHG4_9EURO|nr:hypothetical protein EMPG_14144 [Blastomyces silverae]